MLTDHPQPEATRTEWASETARAEAAPTLGRSTSSLGISPARPRRAVPAHQRRSADSVSLVALRSSEADRGACPIWSSVHPLPDQGCTSRIDDFRRRRKAMILSTVKVEDFDRFWSTF